MATNDGGHEPRSYGDMVMGEYLKGLAEIAKEHPSKIEQLEALEKSATPAPWLYYSHGTGVLGGDVDGMTFFPVAACIGHENGEAVAAARNALPALLAVAKAAKAVVNLARQMERGEIGGSHVMSTAANEAEEALSRLEAQ